MKRKNKTATVPVSEYVLEEIHRLSMQLRNIGLSGVSKASEAYRSLTNGLSTTQLRDAQNRIAAREAEKTGGKPEYK